MVPFEPDHVYADAFSGVVGSVEGTYPVPAAFNITKDMMGQLASLKQIAGPFSYATLQDDPVSVKHLAGDTFLPVIKVPGSVFIINTTGP